MARLFLLTACITFLAFPFSAVTETGAASFANAQRLAPLVKERFKLFVAVSRCGFADDQYAFNVALEKFRGPDRETLRNAAYDGWAAGAAAADAGACPVAVDRLRAADDKLLAQTEAFPKL